MVLLHVTTWSYFVSLCAMSTAMSTLTLENLGVPAFLHGSRSLTKRMVLGLTPTGKLKIEIPVVPPFVKILRKEFKSMSTGGTDGFEDYDDFVMIQNSTTAIPPTVMIPIPTLNKAEFGDLQQGFEYPTTGDGGEEYEYYVMEEGEGMNDTLTTTEATLPKNEIVVGYTNSSEAGIELDVKTHLQNGTSLVPIELDVKTHLQNGTSLVPAPDSEGIEDVNEGSAMEDENDAQHNVTEPPAPSPGSSWDNAENLVPSTGYDASTTVLPDDMNGSEYEDHQGLNNSTEPILDDSLDAEMKTWPPSLEESETTVIPTLEVVETPESPSIDEEPPPTFYHDGTTGSPAVVDNPEPTLFPGTVDNTGPSHSQATVDDDGITLCSPLLDNVETTVSPVTATADIGYENVQYESPLEFPEPSDSSVPTTTAQSKAADEPALETLAEPEFSPGSRFPKLLVATTSAKDTNTDAQNSTSINTATSSAENTFKPNISSKDELPGDTSAETPLPSTPQPRNVTREEPSSHKPFEANNPFRDEISGDTSAETPLPSTSEPNDVTSEEQGSQKPFETNTPFSDQSSGDTSAETPPPSTSHPNDVTSEESGSEKPFEANTPFTDEIPGDTSAETLLPSTKGVPVSSVSTTDTTTVIPGIADSKPAPKSESAPPGDSFFVTIFKMAREKTKMINATFTHLASVLLGTPKINENKEPSRFHQM